MLDFEVQRCTRRCAASDRELKPGETFYSVLVVEGAHVARYDYSEQAWRAPPPGALGWWKSQMPEANAKKLHWAPNDVMLHYFEQLEGDASQEDVRYVLSLLMIRRRIVRLEESETDAFGREVLVLYCPRNERQYRAIAATPGEQRIGEIQEELARLLFADAT